MNDENTMKLLIVIDKMMGVMEIMQKRLDVIDSKIELLFKLEDA